MSQVGIIRASWGSRASASRASSRHALSKARPSARRLSTRRPSVRRTCGCCYQARVRVALSGDTAGGNIKRDSRVLLAGGFAGGTGRRDSLLYCQTNLRVLISGEIAGGTVRRYCGWHYQARFEGVTRRRHCGSLYNASISRAGFIHVSFTQVRPFFHHMKRRFPHTILVSLTIW